MKRIIAMILSLCLLLSAIPFAAAENTEKSLHQLVWETFALENEAGETTAFDEEAVAALVAKLISGEELTEDELAL